MGSENYKKILILCAVLAVGIIIVSVILVLKKDEKKPKKDPDPTDNIEKIIEDEARMQSVIITDIDLDSSVIKVMDIETGEEKELTFTGGSDIRTKTGRVISAQMLSRGNIVKVSFDENNRLQALYGHDKVWNYKNIEKIKIEEDSQKIDTGSSIYRYDRLLVLNGGEFTDVGSILADGTDVLDLYGIDDKVYLIKVSSGHGILTLKNPEDFIDGTIRYGLGKTDTVTDDMKLVLREGDYEIVVENNGYEAKATVRIKNNEVTEFDLSGYGPEPVVYGEVTFKINPDGADLYIDGVKTLYKEPVKLQVGHHDIEAVLGGYIEYTGSLEVSEGSVSKQITLSPAPEEKSEDIVYEDTPEDEDDQNRTGNLSENGNSTIRDGTDNADLSTYSDVNIPDSTSDDGNNGNIEVIDGDKPDTGNNGGKNGSGNQSGVQVSVVGGSPEDDDEKEGDTDTGQPGGDTGNGGQTVSTHGTLVIRTSEGTEVFINGSSAGLVTGGELKVDKPIGTIELELKKQGYVSKTYMVTLDESEDEEIYRFPEMTPVS